MQSRTRRRDDARWVLPGAPVTVHGFDIPCGMVYVGNFLTAAPGGGWGNDIPAPCLINPALRIASNRVKSMPDMGYWPSYSDITPEHRLDYLTWLSTGRCDPSLPVGYAFLYFYGLERRLLVDCPKPEEEALLVAEIERLRDLYTSNGSFQSYSRAMLDVIELRRVSSAPSGLEAWKPDVNTISRGSEMPLPLKLKLALHAVSGMPVDCEHATAAMLAMPPYQGGPPSSIGMSRTRQEFIELVRRRFPARFPKGFPLRDRKDSTMLTAYRAASQHLDVELCIQGVSRLPDPTLLTWTRMSELCAKAAEDLAPYAKLVGKDRSRADSLVAAMTLPAELADLGVTAAFKQFLDGLPVPVATVPLADLGRWCFGQETNGLKQVREMSAMLATFGFGMEPDPTHGGERPGTSLLLFRLGAADRSAALPLSFHEAALVTSVLATGEPGPDPARVISELVTRLQLGAALAIRLAARHRLTGRRPLSPGKLKTLIGGLSEVERSSVAAMAASVAAACGEVSHATLAALERLHDACGADRRGLYAVLHQGAAASASFAAEPVVVEQRTVKSASFRVPPPPKPPIPAASTGGVTIDMAKVHAILRETRETREVAEVLAPIYEEEEAIATVPQPVAAATTDGEVTRFPGLNADHALLLGALCTRTSWNRADFEAQARGFDLLPDGAIETINEWAYDALNDALIEDGDPISLNVALLPETPEEAA